ncbi:MAG: serine O-acetyltransferase [Solirubrobacterales bacterium]
MIGRLARMAGEVARDVTAARERDPAARGLGSSLILTTYPGVQAVLSHRVAHELWDAGVPVVPRALAGFTRRLTGIEIHPAARLGQAPFIDHGMGVVIGETAEIGDSVTIYQGVTLGGTGQQRGKRHPTVGDEVTIGSGAKLLGPVRVGDRAKVGANTVVITDVPDDATVVGNPGHTVRVEGRHGSSPDSDWIHLPDPVADAIRGLADRISALEHGLAELAGTDAPPADDTVRPLRPKKGRSSAGG